MMTGQLSQRRQLRFLAVDDEEALRLLLQRTLRQRGHHCDVAADGAAALQMATNEDYDLIITDLRMPRCNGHSLSVELLQLEHRPAVVVVTGIAEPRLARDLKARGVAEIFYKPVSPMELVPRIESFAMERMDRMGQHVPVDAAAEKPDTTIVNPKSGTPAARLRRSSPDIAGSVNRVILVLTNEREISEQLADAVSTDSTSGIPCESSDDLLMHLKEEGADILIIQNELAGFLTGLEILDRMQKAVMPVESILLAEPSEELQPQADAVGVHSILQPGSAADSITDAVESLLRQMEEEAGFIPPKAQRLVQMCDDVPALPQLLVKLLGFMQRESRQIPIDELSRDISTDPRATADLLRFTNSSALGLGNEIRRVSDAVALLGPKRAISLVFSSAVSAIKYSTVPSEIQAWFYQRSILTASAAATFGERLEKISGDLAFTMGMLQDIGIVVMASHNCRYSSLIQRFRTTALANLERMEGEDFGTNHAEVGAALLNEWGLPQSFVRPILDHHRDEDARRYTQAEASIRRVMQIGEAFADLSDVPDTRRRNRLNQLLSHYGPAKSSICQAALKDSAARAKEASGLLSLPVPDEETLAGMVTEVCSETAEYCNENINCLV